MGRIAFAGARDAGGPGGGAPDWGVAPPAGLMSIYSVVKELITKDPWRGKRQGRDEPRAQESGARVYGSLAGVSPQAAYSGEAKAPKAIIQEEKKDFLSLIIVFMEIQPVTDFTERYRRGETGEFPGVNAGIK